MVDPENHENPPDPAEKLEEEAGKLVSEARDWRRRKSRRGSRKAEKGSRRAGGREGHRGRRQREIQGHAPRQGADQSQHERGGHQAGRAHPA